VYFFEHRWIRLPPTGEELQDCTIAVSDGHGRLYVIDLSSGEGMAALPIGVLPAK
jgi:hypothetical protein